LVEWISRLAAKKLGPGAVRNLTLARPGTWAEWMIRGRLSANRCIHKQCKSMRVSLAWKSPRAATVSSTSPPRIAAAYSSGSVKVRTALEGIWTSPAGFRRNVLEGR